MTENEIKFVVKHEDEKNVVTIMNDYYNTFHVRLTTIKYKKLFIDYVQEGRLG